MILFSIHFTLSLPEAKFLFSTLFMLYVSFGLGSENLVYNQPVSHSWDLPFILSPFCWKMGSFMEEKFLLVIPESVRVKRKISRKHRLGAMERVHPISYKLLTHWLFQPPCYFIFDSFVLFELNYLPPSPKTMFCHDFVSF